MKISTCICLMNSFNYSFDLSSPWAKGETMIMGVWAAFFSLGPKMFSFFKSKSFSFEPKENKIREDNFSEMKERKKSSSVFVVWERIYNVKFNMNVQTWLLNHYWLFLLEYFYSSQGGLGPKGCVGHTPMTMMILQNISPWLMHLSSWSCNLLLSILSYVNIDTIA